MEKHARFFTLDEANAVLPELSAILKRFDQKKHASEKIHDELLMEELLGEMSKKDGKTLDRLEHIIMEEVAKLDRAIEELETEIRAIRALGCKVRNLSKGWIDFPAEKEGRAVFFVWKRGEDSVRYYRPVEDSSRIFPLGA